MFDPSVFAYRILMKLSWDSVLGSAPDSLKGMRQADQATWVRHWDRIPAAGKKRIHPTV